MLVLLHNIIRTVSPGQVRHMQRTAIITAYLATCTGCGTIRHRHLFLAAMLDDIHALKKGSAKDADVQPLTSAISAIRFLAPAVVVCDMPLLRMAGAFERFLTRTGGSRNLTPFLTHGGHWPGRLVDALKESAKEEGFWFRLSSASPDKVLNALSPLHYEMLDHHDLLEVCPLISCIMDMHSGATARHSAGVSRMAQVLAALYGLEAEMQQKIAIAGYLHDVGKLLVPRKIIEKKGPLDPSEYALMKQHSYKTLELLTAADAPCDIARWAANHHERLDGSGYPFRLRAASLDTPSRIVAVADIFTALTENRPYRRGMPVADALAIIQSEAKNHRLDKEIVALLAQKIHLGDKDSVND